MPFIRSISGLRATLGSNMTPALIADYGSAFAKYSPDGPIVIGRDGRPSGEWIEQILTGTLTACGREVRLLGVVPTPTVQMRVEHSPATGGIAITASHNPKEWNGMKFINSNGVFLDKNENIRLWDIADNKEFEYVEQIEKKPIVNTEAINDHIKKIIDLPIFSRTNVLDNINNSGIIAAVDSVNSSGSVAVPSLLAKLRIESIRLFCDGTGIFPHTPEPIPQNLKDLADTVRMSKSDIGIAVDPDADRLVLIDETGNPIGEELTITLAVKAVLKFIKYFDHKGIPAIVVNHSTTRRVEDIAEQYSAKVYRSPVGEINVVKMMKEKEAIIGGEGSGGVILPACHYGRDSLVGIALIIALLADEGKPLSQIVNDLPEYEMIKTKIPVSGDISSDFDRIKAEFRDFEIIEDDGIKLVQGKKWVQLRASNTEPIIRIIAEAESIDQANEMVAKVKNAL